LIHESLCSIDKRSGTNENQDKNDRLKGGKDAPYKTAERKARTAELIKDYYCP
jgi:hypothetical protein